MAHYYEKDEFWETDWLGNPIDEPVNDENHLTQQESSVVQEQEELLDELVDDFAALMKAKLFEKSRQGWNNWRNCDADVFRKSLIEHIEKGDPIDVANIAFFLYALNATTNKPIENLIDANAIQDEDK